MGYLCCIWVLKQKLHHKKHKHMKKLLIVLAIGTFAACNSGTSSETTEDTTTVAPADTSVTAPVDTSMVAPTDTTLSDTTH